MGGNGSDIHRQIPRLRVRKRERCRGEWGWVGWWAEVEWILYCVVQVKFPYHGQSRARSNLSVPVVSSSVL